MRQRGCRTTPETARRRRKYFPDWRWMSRPDRVVPSSVSARPRETTQLCSTCHPVGWSSPESMLGISKWRCLPSRVDFSPHIDQARPRHRPANRGHRDIINMIDFGGASANMTVDALVPPPRRNRERCASGRVGRAKCSVPCWPPRVAGIAHRHGSGRSTRTPDLLAS